MGNFQFKKLFYWFAFIVLGFFSCYWTSESLYIWQPVLGMAGSWLLAILFYVMASLSFSLILKALNKNIDFYGKFLGRGASLFLGLVGLLLFWLVCSMPTNTHTLLYNAEIRNVMTKDLSETIDYLQAFNDRNSQIDVINARYDAKRAQVDGVFVNMLSEMDGNSNVEYRGIGPRFRTLVAELNTILAPINGGRTNSIQEARNPGHNQTQWLATFNSYKLQADAILSRYRQECNAEIANIKNQLKKDDLNELIRRCNIAKGDVYSMKGVNNEILDSANVDLTHSYAFIGANSRMIVFKSVDDSIRYCAEGAQPRVKALQVVPQVWTDFLTTGRYDGHGFGWWILLSMLVDMAGFIFFYLANKE